MLPNPDPILRRSDKYAEVFDAIASDAHVMGELRSIKSDLNRFQHVLVPGDDSRKAGRRWSFSSAFCITIRLRTVVGQT